jgi:hypothetical protein
MNQGEILFGTDGRIVLHSRDQATNQMSISEINWILKKKCFNIFNEKSKKSMM